MTRSHLVTFSDESMSRSRELCHKSWLIYGATSWWPFSPQVQYEFEEFATFPSDWFKRRGCGFWLWKPAILNYVMGKVAIGDIIVYADVGVEFINNVSHIIERMGPMETRDVMLLPEREASTGGPADIFLFGNNWEHAHWCKRDAAETVWPCNDESRCPSPHYEFWDKFGKQVQASVLLFRVSDYTRTFVKEWLDWCLFEGGRLIDDSPSRLPNHPEFREHRHDQAILTTMAYREGIKLHYWPAVYNKGGSPEFVYEKLPEYAGDDYPVLFSHHRKRNHEWENAA